MKLNFIVNGVQTEITTNSSIATVYHLALIALDQTKNDIRPDKPIDDWQIICKDNTLNLNLPISKQQVPIVENDVIFMSLKAGTGA